MPAFLSGDLSRARDLARGELSRLYHAHRRVIDEIVTLQRADNSTHEVRATDLVRWGPVKLTAMFLGTMSASLIGFALLARSIIRPLRQMAEHATEVLGDRDESRGGRTTDVLGHLGASLDAAYTEASRDDLTGLLTRRALLRRMTEDISFARRQGTDLSVILFDVDRFKHVNDRHGHLAGDAVLREISQRLLSAIRLEDIAGRFGGDELVVVARGSARADAAALAERVRSELCAAPVDAGGASLPITLSAGVASLQCCADTKDANALLARADACLYRAKHDGRDRVVVCECALGARKARGTEAGLSGTT